MKYHPFQISVISDCTLKRLGDLPFDFAAGTCGTFMIASLPTILLCFDYYEERKCRLLTRKNDGTLTDINDFAFDSEFQIDEIVIPDSTHDHYQATIANYQGFPLILGGGSFVEANNGRFQTLFRESVKFSNYGKILWPCYFASKVDPLLKFSATRTFSLLNY